MYYALFTYTVCAEMGELENCHVERKPFLSITSVSIFINLVDICNLKSLVFLQVLHDFSDSNSNTHYFSGLKTH